MVDLLVRFTVTRFQALIQALRKRHEQPAPRRQTRGLNPVRRADAAAGARGLASGSDKDWTV
jgi:hypothetical protein